MNISRWEILSEEASIVLVGDFNPKIFHPEWFIRKGIVEEWEYSRDESVSVMKDMAQIGLPNDRLLEVFLDRFSIRTPNKTQFYTLNDLVSGTFGCLPETPIRQMGMNYTSVIKIGNLDDWKSLGKKIVPQEKWIEAAGYIEELEEKQQEKTGVWEVVMNLPRPDDYSGYIRAKLAVFLQGGERVISFGINNHIAIDDNNALNMISILEDSWLNSVRFAEQFTQKVMDSYLG